MVSLAAAKSIPNAIDRVRTLTEANIDALRLDAQAKLAPDDVRRILFSYPGRSVWLPETLEFAIVSPWRHRAAVANIQELVAARQPEVLVEAVVERCARTSAALVVMIELDEVRPPAFYDRVGFQLLEEVVMFELDRLPPVGGVSGRLRFLPADPFDAATRATLVAIDWAAFPWLWRNNDLEFNAYGLVPGVELFIGYLDHQPIAYLGITAYLGWGHLDRIAVLPSLQGQGYGQEALAFAIDRLARLGAQRIGLSTQRGNMRSRHLYERFGFRRVWGNDYRLYGRFLRPIGEGEDDGRRGPLPKSTALNGI
jgi:RimJ/RimL family protein N-acetyltransferase